MNPENSNDNKAIMSPRAEGIECIKKQVGCIGIIRHFFNDKVFKLMAVIQEKKIFLSNSKKNFLRHILVGKTLRIYILDKSISIKKSKL